MSEFKNYRRIQIAEMRAVTKEDVICFEENGYFEDDGLYDVSISDTDLNNGSPKIGDMIARNPKNNNDQWLVAKQYFEDNFENVI